MADGRDILTTRLKESENVLGTIDIDVAMRFVEVVWGLSVDNKIIFIGNGASNTIASHAALDYMSQTGKKTISVNDPSILTAFSNDFGYENVFERFVKISYVPGDILVCVSSSGKSENVIRAARYVSVQGMVVSFTGFDKDNALSRVSAINFWADSKHYNIVESIHNTWLAIICDVLTARMGDKAGPHGIEI